MLSVGVSECCNFYGPFLKSVNLQCSTLGCLNDGTNKYALSDVLSIIHFHDFLQNSLQNSFQFIFLFFYNITKMKIKSFQCPKSIKNIKKNNTWNITLLVDDLFVPSFKQPSVIYYRLKDFKMS